MKRRWLLIVPALFAALLWGAYLLLDVWLESAGGRQAVERALAERLGLPVRLQGEFRVMLLPRIGVSGTALIVGQPGTSGEVARGSEYAVSLALAPLLERRLLIESISLAGGALYLDRLPESPATEASSPPLQLPEVRHLEVRDFDVVPAGEPSTPYRLRELSIEQFAEGRETPFRIEVVDYGAWFGSLSWDPQSSALAVTATGTGHWPGRIHLQAGLLLAQGSGNLEVAWQPAPESGDPVAEVRLTLDYSTVAGGLRFSNMHLLAGAAVIEGHGCLATNGQTVLNLDLHAERLDLDQLPDLGELGAAPGSAEQGSLSGLELNARLTAAELLASGAIARQAVLRVGSAPDCRALDAAVTP